MEGAPTAIVKEAATLRPLPASALTARSLVAAQLSGLFENVEGYTAPPTDADKPDYDEDIKALISSTMKRGGKGAGRR